MLWGGCEALATPRPLGPLVDIADELGGELAEALRSNRPPHELFHAFLQAVRAHEGPTVVVVEDAHWADDASADFLKFVARRIARYPLLLAVTYRDDEVSPGHPMMRAVGTRQINPRNSAAGVTITPSTVCTARPDRTICNACGTLNWWR